MPMDFKITVRTPEEAELASRMAEAINAAGEHGMCVGSVLNMLDLIRTTMLRASTAHVWEAETRERKPKKRSDI